MSVEFKYTNNCLYALIGGEIDHHTAADIRIRADAEIERLLPKYFIFDFSDVQFMDSSGIGLILGRLRLIESIGGALSIKPPPPNVRKMIMLAGLSRLITEQKNSEKERNDKR